MKNAWYSAAPRGDMQIVHIQEIQNCSKWPLRGLNGGCGEFDSAGTRCTGTEVVSGLVGMSRYTNGLRPPSFCLSICVLFTTRHELAPEHGKSVRAALTAQKEGFWVQHQRTQSRYALGTPNTHPDQEHTAHAFRQFVFSVLSRKKSSRA